MKKIIKAMATSLCLITVSAAVGCGPKPQTSGNGGGGRLYTIQVAVTNAGFGLDWAKTLAKEYNEMNPNSDYGIEIVDYGMKWADQILTDLALGNGYQMYINSANEITTGIYKNYFEDISDILDDNVDGENQGTVQQKITNFDQWKDNYSKFGEGLYALPYSNGVVGMVIDHQEFIDNGWYCFEDEAKTVLTVGKDGIRGTYDDGQPQTLAEFNAMLERITVNAKPFIYGGGVTAYLDYIYNSIFAQYAGNEEYSAFVNYDSKDKEVRLVDGTTTPISLGNGYKVYEMKALTQAYEIFENWFDYTSGTAKDYVHSICKNTSASQYDTQNMFLLGYKGAASNPKSAIMIDGIWWENEAKAMFNSLDNVNRGYGDREYRMLLLPTFEGQQETKSCVSVCTAGVMAIPKDKNAERLAVTKDFLKFLIKDESLRTITNMTGDILGYDYEIDVNNAENMTPFQKNMAQMYADKENVRIVSLALDRVRSPLAYASDKGEKSTLYPFDKNNVVTLNCLDAVKKLNGSEITTGLANRYTKQTWASYIQQAKNGGFFAD
ncbi:MAG: hypothetical protein IJB34_00320 [Clostridia bacterium]|nr:hypothetical protein [Clostridia bacterium]